MKPLLIAGKISFNEWHVNTPYLAPTRVSRIGSMQVEFRNKAQQVESC